MQSRRHSLYEALTNTVVGYLLALGVQYVVFDWYDLHVTFFEMNQIVVIFTVVSILRNYACRRFWNHFHVRATKKVMEARVEDLKFMVAQSMQTIREMSPAWQDRPEDTK